MVDIFFKAWYNINVHYETFVMAYPYKSKKDSARTLSFFVVLSIFYLNIGFHKPGKSSPKQKCLVGKHANCSKEHWVHFCPNQKSIVKLFHDLFLLSKLEYIPLTIRRVLPQLIARARPLVFRPEKFPTIGIRTIIILLFI